MTDHHGMTTLEQVVDVLDSRRIPVNSKERAERNGAVPYYGATGRVGWIDEALFDEDLILLGEDGVQFFDRDKPKAYLISGPAWVNNHAHVLRARPTIDRRWLCHWLNYVDYRGFANGTTRLKLTQASMRRLPVWVPAMDGQQRIVAVLEDHLSRLDAASTYLAESGRRVDLLMMGATQHMYRKSETSGTALRLSDVGAVVTGSTPSSKLADAFGGDVPFLTPGDIQHGRLIAQTQRTLTAVGASASRLVRAPAVAVVCIGAVGRVGYIRQSVVTNQQINTISVDPTVVDPAFLMHVIAAPSTQRRLQDLATTTTISLLNKRNFSSVEVPLPKIDVQHGLASIFRDLAGRAPIGGSSRRRG